MIRLIFACALALALCACASMAEIRDDLAAAIATSETAQAGASEPSGMDVLAAAPQIAAFIQEARGVELRLDQVDASDPRQRLALLRAGFIYADYRNDRIDALEAALNILGVLEDAGLYVPPD